MMSLALQKTDTTHNLQLFRALFAYFRCVLHQVSMICKIKQSLHEILHLQEIAKTKLKRGEKSC